MSDEVKVEKEVVEESKEQVGSKSPEEVKEVKKDPAAESVLGFSPFVTEDDRFDLVVRCYKEKNDIIVEGVDSDFDNGREDIKDITFTFKYPSQGDFNIIGANASTVLNSDDSPDHINLNKLEFARLLVLVRSWSLPEELDNSNIVSLDPKIIKSVIFGLREKISLNGIF